MFGELEVKDLVYRSAKKCQVSMGHMTKGIELEGRQYRRQHGRQAGRIYVVMDENTGALMVPSPRKKPCKVVYTFWGGWGGSSWFGDNKGLGSYQRHLLVVLHLEWNMMWSYI